MFLRKRQNGTFVPFSYSDEGLVQLLEQSMSNYVAYRSYSCVEGLLFFALYAAAQASYKRGFVIMYFKVYFRLILTLVL